jgi:hypothetical protein
MLNRILQQILQQGEKSASIRSEQCWSRFHDRLHSHASLVGDSFEVVHDFGDDALGIHRRKFMILEFTRFRQMQ